MACVGLVGCGGSGTQAPTLATTAVTSSAATSSAATSSATVAAQPTTQQTATVPPARPRHRRAPSPGSLPQTRELPSSATAQFHGEMRALWRGARSGSLRPARLAFFPEAAYVQLKTIGDPRADYVGRLLYDYGLDLGAARALLQEHAGSAELVDVQVPSSYAHWVNPGVCDNQVGYYEVPNARVVYRQGGELRSFGIASMISWRGVWYVIHLGAVLRPAAEGTVDDPSAGVGVPAPSTTC